MTPAPNSVISRCARSIFQLRRTVAATAVFFYSVLGAVVLLGNLIKGLFQ